MNWSQQGVVKEVVFLNGKQDSKTTIAVQTLLSYLQVGSSAFWIMRSFLLPGQAGWAPKGVRGKEGTEIY